MPRQKELTKAIYDLEFKLAKFKAVLAKFPKAFVNQYDEFQSKEVNQQYHAYDFFRDGWGVTVSPYYELDFEFDNKLHVVRVNSKPLQSKLVYIKSDIVNNIYVRKIHFSKLSFNLKQNSFKDAMLNDCRIEIMNFIKAHSNYAMDTKNLEPRLKKLIIFS